MSISGITLLCQSTLGVNDAALPVYITTFVCSTPVDLPEGVFYGAGVTTLVSAVSGPSSPAIAQAVADQANLETSDAELFVAADVILPSVQQNSYNPAGW
jgi:hypothetical protein